MLLTFTEALSRQGLRDAVDVASGCRSAKKRGTRGVSKFFFFNKEII